MDWVTIRQKVTEGVKKYRYALIVVVIGLVLMMIPGKSDQTQSEPVPEAETAVKSITLQEELEQILSQIKGAGKVSVMLSVASGEKTIYQTDKDVTSGDSISERYETVIITGDDRQESGLIQQIQPEAYLGAIIVCQGADSPTVRLNIVEAVSKITGLGSDRISVLKMK